MVWGCSNVLDRIACKYLQKCRRRGVLEQLKAGDGGDFVSKDTAWAARLRGKECSLLPMLAAQPRTT